jgi:hypothetical protein
MIRKITSSYRRLTLVAFVFVAILVCAMTARHGSTRASQDRQDRIEKEEQEKDRHEGREKFLFVWAGDQARTNPDFLAVINFDEGSADYGKVIRAVPLPGPGANGNEPHHVGLSRDGRVLACGGLLSVLRAQKEIFFFDVSNPRAPKFISAADPPQSAITDEFYPLANGGFLVTMMGGAGGAHPGRVAEFNKDLQLVSEHPQLPPMDGFNPHGISVRPETKPSTSRRQVTTTTPTAARSLIQTDSRRSSRTTNLIGSAQLLIRIPLEPGRATTVTPTMPRATCGSSKKPSTTVRLVTICALTTIVIASRRQPIHCGMESFSITTMRIT